MKTCSKCKTTKPKSEFYTDARKKDGLRSDCKACRAAYNKKNSKRMQEYDRQRKYGLDKINFDLLWDTQRGRCGICEEVFESPTHSHVDHNHATGAVRGLLCNHCNLGLGHFRDSPTRLGAAISYIHAN